MASEYFMNASYAVQSHSFNLHVSLSRLPGTHFSLSFAIKEELQGIQSMGLERKVLEVVAVLTS